MGLCMVVTECLHHGCAWAVNFHSSHVWMVATASPTYTVCGSNILDVAVCGCRYELRVAQPGSDPRMCLGGSCMAFCPAASAHEEAGVLLVGTEGGQLLRCQVGAPTGGSVAGRSAHGKALLTGPVQVNTGKGSQGLVACMTAGERGSLGAAQCRHACDCAV